MRYIFLIFLLAALVLLQSSFLPPLGIHLNLLLIFSLSIVFLGFTRESYYSAFFGGLVLDLLATGVFGISSLLLLMIVWLAGVFKQVVGEGFVTLIPVTFAAAVVFRRGDFKGALADVISILILFPLLKWALPKVFVDGELRVNQSRQ